MEITQQVCNITGTDLMSLILNPNECSIVSCFY